MQKYFLLIAIIFFIFSPVHVFGQTATKAATPTPKVDYQLPYPGLLPGNPFYVFKTIRDRIVSFLIADPLKKAEFNLLQADKRLSTAIALVKEEKEQLAESTISKGENYFEEGIVQLGEARKQGINTDDLTHRYKLAAGKHIEVLQHLSKSAAKEHRPLFAVLIQRMETLRDRL